MTSTCSDPNYVLTDPKCQTIYTDAYNKYIAQMNSYCLTDDHSISNNLCVDYINNNKFIQESDFDKKIKQKASDLCLNNINPNNNSNCINSYNITPLLVKKKQEEIIKQQEEKDALKQQNTKIFIMIFLFIMCLLGGGIYYKMKKNISSNTLNSNQFKK